MTILTPSLCPRGHGGKPVAHPATRTDGSVAAALCRGRSSGYGNVRFTVRAAIAHVQNPSAGLPCCPYTVFSFLTHHDVTASAMPTRRGVRCQHPGRTRRCHTRTAEGLTKSCVHAAWKSCMDGRRAGSRCSSCSTGCLNAPSRCACCALSCPSHGSGLSPLSISTACTAPRPLLRFTLVEFLSL